MNDNSLQAQPRGYKLIDYRNARYQGALAGGNRQGIGVAIDDDWKVYIGQWKQGKMHGKGILMLPSGEYVYGQWQEGKVHGTSVFRNKQALYFMNYHKGGLVGKVIAVADSGQFLIVAWGDGRQLQTPQTVKITDLSNYHSLVKHMAKKYDILLDKHFYTISHFLTYLNTLAPQLQLNTRDGLTYFGIVNGLGLRFQLKGRLNHKLSLTSIGHYQRHRIDELGVKFHQNRCIEQGNFATKQTVTYQRLLQRPQDKCINIQQKAHKRSINFVNEYLDIGNGVMGYLVKIDQNISVVMQEQIGATHQPQKQQVTKSQSTQSKLAKNLSRPSFTRSANKSNNKSTSGLLKLKPVLQDKQLKNSPKRTQNDHNIKKHPYLKARQHSKSISGENKVKKSPHQAMTQKSPNRKKNIPYTSPKSRSPLNPTNTNYIRQAYKLDHSSIAVQRKISKNEVQRENELKIRVELAQKQQVKKNYRNLDQETFRDYIRSPLPYSPLASLNPAQHHVSSWELPSAFSPSNPVDEDKEYLKELQRKREDVLHQYRMLNLRESPTASPPRYNQSIFTIKDSLRHSNSYRQYVPAYDQAGVQEFNRRYRNYLQKDPTSLSPQHDFNRSPSINRLHVYTPGRRNKYQYFFEENR